MLPGIVTDMEELIDIFKEVRECDYKDEHYSVRDNGAVMRHQRPGKRLRPSDNAWTFGAKNDKNGYMHLGAHRIHIIVAIAFHGERDSKKFVVDHIDTNRCNNRPENLRWFTRLENALNNPITFKRIEWLCGGDIQKFIDDPSCIRTEGKWPDLEWMRTVTPEEARNAKANLERWASQPFVPRDPNAPALEKKDKEWMFKPPQSAWTPPVEPRPVPYVRAISPALAVQVRWNTASEFPACPQEITDNTLVEYAKNLQPGTVFSTNGLWTSVVDEVALIDNGTRLAVATHPMEGIKGAVAVVYVRDGLIFHETVGTFFDPNGTKKCMTELKGLKWEGPDCIDDYC